MFKFYTDVVDIIKHFFQMEKLLFGSVDNAKKKEIRSSSFNSLQLCFWML